LRIRRPGASAATAVTAASTGSHQLDVIHCELTQEIQIELNGIWHGIGRAGIILPINQSSRDWDGNDDVKVHVGWVVELVLDAMTCILFRIPDPRLLHTHDERFIRQFQITAEMMETSRSHPSNHSNRMPRFHRFIPYAMDTLAYVRDNSMWIKSIDGEPTLTPQLYSTLVLNLIGWPHCASISVVDEFIHPTRGHSIRFRLIYHSADGSLSPQDVSRMQRRLEEHLVSHNMVEMR